jgi:hypothetical protein
MTTISYSEPDTRYEAPDDKQLAALLKIVEGAHPDWPKVELAEFKLAMYAVGRMWRLDAPSTQYSFAHFVDAANEALQARRLGQINGPAFLRAVVAMNDIMARDRDGRGLFLSPAAPAGRRARESSPALVVRRPPIRESRSVTLLRGLCDRPNNGKATSPSPWARWSGAKRSQDRQGRGQRGERVLANASPSLSHVAFFDGGGDNR